MFHQLLFAFFSSLLSLQWSDGLIKLQFRDVWRNHVHNVQQQKMCKTIKRRSLGITLHVVISYFAEVNSVNSTTETKTETEKNVFDLIDFSAKTKVRHPMNPSGQIDFVLSIVLSLEGFLELVFRMHVLSHLPCRDPSLDEMSFCHTHTRVHTKAITRGTVIRDNRLQRIDTQTDNELVKVKCRHRCRQCCSSPKSTSIISINVQRQQTLRMHLRLIYNTITWYCALSSINRIAGRWIGLSLDDGCSEHLWAERSEQIANEKPIFVEFRRERERFCRVHFINSTVVTIEWSSMCQQSAHCARERIRGHCEELNWKLLECQWSDTR